MQPMAYVLGFLALLLAVEGLGLFWGHRRRSDSDRVRRRLGSLAKRRRTEPEGNESLVRRRATGGIAGWLMRRIPSLASLDVLLYRAGMPTTPPRLGFFSLVTAALGWAALSAVARSPLVASLGVLAGAIPWLVVRRMARKRMRRFAEQLPEGLELLTRALRAGHGLASGFQLVGDELEDPIGTEFGLVAEEVRFGLDLRDALEGLNERLENEDLPYFTTAVLIQRQTGGNLAELLDKLSALVRERSQFQGRVRALTAQGRGAALFLSLWLPAITLIVYLVSPEYMQPLIENRWGHFVLMAAAAVDVIAYGMARRIADVQA